MNHKSLGIYFGFWARLPIARFLMICVLGGQALSFGFASDAHAAVITAASASFTDVSAAVTQAADGDTVQIPAGAATWTQSIDISQGLTVQGAGAAQTVITNNIPGLGSYANALFNLNDGGANTLRRVTQIGMRSNTITNVYADRQGNGVAAFGYGSLKRIDHCQFDDLVVGLYIGNSNGVSDHNTYHNVGVAFRHVGHGRDQQYSWDHFRPVAFDSLNFIFHENETIEITGDGMVSDEVEANSYVVRNSSVTLREAHGPYSAAQCYPLFDVHGDIPPTGQYAALTTLIYNNDIKINSGAAMSFMQLRGGSALVFNNRVVTNGGAGSAAVQLREERYEYGLCNVNPPLNPNYSCWPAWADPQYEDVVHDVYIWNNTYNGVVQVPWTDTYSSGLIIGSDPQTAPNANAWTVSPNPLFTPIYPHPLVTGGNLSNPTPTPSPTSSSTPGATPTPVPPPLGASETKFGSFKNILNLAKEKTLTINFEVAGPAHVTLTLYDRKGTLLKKIVDDERRGQQSVVWDGTNASGAAVASGVFILQLKAGEVNQTKKVVVVK